MFCRNNASGVNEKVDDEGFLLDAPCLKLLVDGRLRTDEGDNVLPELCVRDRIRRGSFEPLLRALTFAPILQVGRCLNFLMVEIGRRLRVLERGEILLVLLTESVLRPILNFRPVMVGVLRPFVAGKPVFKSGSDLNVKLLLPFLMFGSTELIAEEVDVFRVAASGFNSLL